MYLCIINLNTLCTFSCIIIERVALSVEVCLCKTKTKIQKYFPVFLYILEYSRKNIYL